LGEALREGDPGGGARHRVTACRVGGLDEQATERLEHGRAGQRVVADVKEAAGLEALRDGTEQRVAGGRCDPREHAVRRRVVERWQIVTREAREVALEKGRVLEPAASREAPSGGHVARIEIDAVEAGARIGGREGGGGVAVAAPEVGVGEVFGRRGREPRERRDEAKTRGGEVLEERPDVGDVGDVFAAGHDARRTIPRGPSATRRYAPLRAGSGR
jgi:hypothetical protein